MTKGYSVFRVEVHNGASRKVFLWWKYALKVPQTSYGPRNFYFGLLANLQERSWWKLLRAEKCCPVLASDCLGLFVVMPRCDPREEELSSVEYAEVVNFSEDYVLPVERKPDSFGYLDGKLVAIDYGDWGE